MKYTARLYHYDWTNQIIIISIAKKTTAFLQNPTPR